MFTGLKVQLEITDTLIDDILPQDNELIKLKKAIDWEKINKIYRQCFPSDLISKKIIDGRILLTDTTSLEKNIIYPTEVSLLSRVIKEAAVVTQNIRYKKDLALTETVKKAKKISKVYYSASRKTKKLLKYTTSALLLVAKDQIDEASCAIDSMADSVSAVTIERLKRLNTVGKKIVSQVESKLDERPVAKRILSYHEEACVSLPKSRPGKPCAFGDKLSISVSGNGYVTDHRLYDSNIADIDTLEDTIANHLKKFGKKFKEASADRAYYDRDLIEELERAHKIKIAIPHKKRREPLAKDKEDLYKRRAAIEAKISEGKRMTGMGKSYYSGFSGDRVWAGLSVLALNLRQLLKDMARNPELIYQFG